MKETLQGRCVGILIADGSDAAAINKLINDVKKAGGTSKLVAPRLNGIILSDNSNLSVDGQLAGTPSQIFDRGSSNTFKRRYRYVDERRRGYTMGDGCVRAFKSDWL
jgi:hypothetical protein